jgi:hypothetical protein
MYLFSPEDVIEDRKLFIMKDFLTSFSGGMKDLMEHLRKKFPSEVEEIDAVMQAHPTIFKSSEIGTELSTYASVHKDAREEVRRGARFQYKRVQGPGAFNTREEAERTSGSPPTRSEFRYFHL